MNETPRRLVYRLFIVVAVAVACGRILATQLLIEPIIHDNPPEHKKTGKRPWPNKAPKAMPTFGSNDRSRWATVRALVDEGTYAIGERDKDTVLATAGTPLGLADPWQAMAASMGGHVFRTAIRKEPGGSQANHGIIFEDG